MRFSIVAAFATIGAIGMAQDLAQLPQCAQSCFSDSFGDCSALDIKCICNSAGFINDLSCCIASTCSATDQQTTIEFAVSLCQAQGVSLPTSASCAASAAPTASNLRSSSSTIVSTTTTTTTSSLTSNSSSQVSSSTSSSFSSSTSSSTASPSSSSLSPSPNSDGLSTGTKAAIGTVIPLVILGALVILFYVWRRRRRQIPTFEPADQAHQAPEVAPDGAFGPAPPHPPPYVFDKPELDGSGIPPREMQGMPVMSGGQVWPGAPVTLDQVHRQQAYVQQPYSQHTYGQQQYAQQYPIEIGGVMTMAEMGRATPATKPHVQ